MESTEESGHIFAISRSGRFLNLIEKEQKSIRIKKRSPGSQAFTLEPRGAKRPTPTSGSLAEMTDGSGRESLILNFKNNYWRAQKNPATFLATSRSGRFFIVRWNYSTVTLFARLRGLSGSFPL